MPSLKGRPPTTPTRWPSSRNSIDVAKNVNVAFSGGTTPKAIFDLLADDSKPYRALVPWERLGFFFVDERSVPPDDKDSNYGMAKAALLDKVPIEPSQVYRIQGELNPEEAAAKYESAIRAAFRLEGAQMPQFQLVSLGMGDDGHTASLFPHTEALHELGRIAVANQVPQKDTWRLTLTWPVINRGQDVSFLLEGSGEGGDLAPVFLGGYDPETLPSQLIRPASGQLTLLLDRDAAALLAQAERGRRGRAGGFPLILAGDVGGTKVALALFDFQSGQPAPCGGEALSGEGLSGPGSDCEGVSGGCTSRRERSPCCVLWRAGAGAAWRAAADEFAVDAGQPQALARSGYRPCVPHQRSRSERLWDS